MNSGFRSDATFLSFNFYQNFHWVSDSEKSNFSLANFFESLKNILFCKSTQF